MLRLMDSFLRFIQIISDKWKEKLSQWNFSVYTYNVVLVGRGDKKYKVML